MTQLEREINDLYYLSYYSVSPYFPYSYSVPCDTADYSPVSATVSTESSEDPSTNFTAKQGADFSLNLVWKNDGVLVDLTGYTARMQLKMSYADTVPALSLTSGSGITLGGVLGTIDIAITAIQTAALQATTYLYDLELVSSGGQVTRLLEGKIKVTPEVTT